MRPFGITGLLVALCLPLASSHLAAQTPANAGSSSGVVAHGVRFPSTVRAYALKESNPVRGDSMATMFRYSDGSATRVSVFFYLADSVAPAADARALVAQTGQSFLETLPIGVQRGWYDSYTTAFSDPDSVTVDGRLLLGNATAAATKKDGSVHVELQYVYLIGPRLLKVRASVPAEGWEKTDIPRFARELAWVVGRQLEASRLVGTWTGYWARAGDTLPVTMGVQRDTTGVHHATFDSDRLRVSGIPFAQVSTEGCCAVTLVLRGDRTTAEFKGELHGDSLTGVFREGTSEGRFAYVRARSPEVAFDQRDITFRSGDITLAGTLLLPGAQGRVPAVVFLHGSGAEGRWASRYLASQLASRGIASLIFDKRGVGASSGDWRLATPDDLAADAVAAIARLLEEPRIDPARIGIHGHSQGGTLAPMVAARSSHVAFVIASAAAGLPTDSVEIFSVLNSVLPTATTAADSASAREYVFELVSVAYHGRPRARLDSLAARLKGRPWFFPPPAADNSYWSFSRLFAAYDPIAWWRQVRAPVLLVYGADDQRVPAARSAARIEAALRGAGNAHVTIHMHPGADHTFRLRPGPSGWPVTAPEYIPNLMKWLSQR